MATVEEEQAQFEKETAEAEAAEAASFESENTAAHFEDVEEAEAAPADEEDEQTPEEETEEEITEEVVEEPTKEPKPKTAKITEEQLARILNYSNDIETIKTAVEARFGTAFGKLGSLTQTLKEIQEANSAVGDPVTVSEEDLSELKVDYPDLTPAIAKSLTRVMAKLKGRGVQIVTKDADPEAVAAIVEAKATETSKKVYAEEQIKDLTDDYPNWATVVGAQGSKTEFRSWLAEQPAEYQVKVANSKRAVVVSRALDRFYDYKKVQESEQAKPKRKTAAEVRREQLEDAVNEKGHDSQHQSQSEEDAFNTHMKRVGIG